MFYINGTINVYGTDVSWMEDFNDLKSDLLEKTIAGKQKKK